MVVIFSLFMLLLSLLLQVLIFNHMHLLGGVALVYVCALMKLPVEIPRGLQILLGFLSGLCIDCFCNTPGMHALTGCTLMWMRMPLLHMFVVADDFKSGILGLRTLTMPVYLRFSLIFIGLYCFMLYTVEAFTLFNFVAMMGKIVISILLTLSLSFVIEFTTGRR